MQGLVRLAKRSPDSAEQQVGSVGNTPRFARPERARLNEIALWTVASYGAGSAQRLTRYPPKAMTTNARVGVR